MLPCFARRTSPEAAAIHGTDIEVLDVRSQPQRIKEVSSVVGRAFAGRHSKSRSRAQLALGTRASSPQLPLGDPLRVEFLTFFMGVGVLQHGHPRRGIVYLRRVTRSRRLIARGRRVGVEHGYRHDDGGRATAVL